MPTTFASVGGVTGGTNSLMRFVPLLVAVAVLDDELIAALSLLPPPPQDTKNAEATQAMALRPNRAEVFIWRGH